MTKAKGTVVAIAAISVMLAFTLALILGGTQVAASGHNHTSQQSNNPYATKQKGVALQKSWHVKHDTKIAPKSASANPNGNAAPAFHSCPAAKTAPYIVDASKNQPFPGQNFVSWANVTSTNGIPYLIYGGNNEIILTQIAQDRCSPNQASYPTKHFPDSAKPGKIIFTSATENIIFFRTSLGITGSFNYVTGQYL